MIIHLDADAFFASVEQAACARLRGKAVAVGGMKRGIIASASYEARRYGVHTPMPTSQALRLCPHLVLLPGDFEKYETFSRFMFSYFYDFSPEVEIASIDEGYCDVTGQKRWRAEEAADRVRRAIGQSLKLSVSEGVASNKLVSQIASKLRKPHGFVLVGPGHEREFLAPLEVEHLPGVGPKLRIVFHRAGLQTIGQVAALPAARLHAVAGGLADTLAEFARGIDRRPVRTTSEPAKSYGAQQTFAEDTCDSPSVRDTLRCLADDLLETLRQEDAAARTVSVKIRYTDMDEAERSESLDEPSRLPEDFYGLIDRLLAKAWDRRVRLRMVRLRFSSIYRGWPVRDLLYALEGRDRRERLQAVVAEVQGRYGPRALMRGHRWRQQARPANDNQDRLL